MASLPYPLNWLYNHGRVGMAGMPYPPTDCRSYIKINMNTYLCINLIIKAMKKIVLMVMLAMSILTSNAQSEYPTSKVEKHDVAILVIDMQNDFVDPKGKLCVAGAKATIPAINKLIAYGRSKNWKVVWITRDHRPSIPNFL